MTETPASSHERTVERAHTAIREALDELNASESLRSAAEKVMTERKALWQKKA